MDGLLIETFPWWFVEGLSKWLLFLSFWFVTPAVLPVAIVRQIAGPVSFAMALYTVALAAAIANFFLPPDWKFVPDRLPSRSKAELNQELIAAAIRAEERTSSKPGQETGGLTHSPILADYTKWKEQYDKRKGPRQMATIVMLLATLGLTGLGRSQIRRHLPVVLPAASKQPGAEQGQRAVVIGAWLFALGTGLDFLKWWFDPA